MRIILLIKRQVFRILKATGLDDAVRHAYRAVRAHILSYGLHQRRYLTPFQSDSEIDAMKQISVVVCIHDGFVVTRRCLTSLEAFGRDCEIVLIDDCSTCEETLSLLNDFVQRNRWVLHTNNVQCGHSRSCEIGARYASREFICFLNNDTVVTQHSWGGVIDAFRSDEAIAAAGPSTSWSIPPQMITRAMYCRHYWSNAQIFSFAAICAQRYENDPISDIEEVSGFAFFIRRSIWDSMGGFDPALPDYGNESELCVRLRKVKFRLVHARTSYIHHLGRQSYGRNTLTKRLRALEIITTKHGSSL